MRQRATAYVLVYGLFVVLFTIAFNCRADTWLTISGLSYHFDRENEHNEFNAGLGLEYDLNSDSRAAAGVFKNSFYRWSFYAGATYQPIKFKELHGGVTLGVVTGYEERVLPLVIPSVAWERENHGVNLFIVPAHGATSTVLGLQFKKRFQ